MKEGAEMGEAVFEYVFEQEVRATRVERYYALSKHLHELASRQPGFLSQERHPVSEVGEVWKFRTTLRFDTAEHCVSWLDNPERRRLLNLEEREAGFAFQGHGNWEGYARWLSRGLAAEPPKWKVNLLVLLMLYPTVMVLTPLLHVVMGGASFPLTMLVSNALCVAATSWVLVPLASRVYAGWLEGELSAGQSALALGSVIALLAGILAVCQWLPKALW